MRRAWRRMGIINKWDIIISWRMKTDAGLVSDSEASRNFRAQEEKVKNKETSFHHAPAL